MKSTLTPLILGEFTNSAEVRAETRAEAGLDLINEVSIADDGWMRIAPYGDFPGMARRQNAVGGYVETPAIQRMDVEAANEMVANFNSLGSRIARFVRSLPIFNGHPDAIGIGHRYPDKREHGRIARIEARPDGLYALPTFNNDGESLLASTKSLAPSARWSARDLGEENGKRIMRPCHLLSVALTRTPNLPVEAINTADAAEATQQADQDPTDMKLPVILEALKKHGVEIANSAEKPATEADVLTGIDSLGSRAAAVATVQSELTNERTRITTAESAVAAARQELANERAGRIEDSLDAAMEKGQITAAERDQWAKRLNADFANERQALLKLEAKVKTQSAVNVVDRKADVSAVDAGKRLIEIANDIYAAMPEADRERDPSRCWLEANKQAAQQHPELVALAKAK